jgi:hypothetical protein
MYATTNSFGIDFSKGLRLLLIVAMLTVGALNVTRCGNDDGDIERALRDQHDRMSIIVGE